MKLSEHWRGDLTAMTIESHAEDGYILYIFPQSLVRARHRATTHPGALVHGPDVADVADYGLSLVWMGHAPYLFPGSLEAASHRGKTWKGARRKDSAIALYHQRLEAAGFAKQYGDRIGEKSGGR